MYISFVCLFSNEEEKINPCPSSVCSEMVEDMRGGNGTADVNSHTPSQSVHHLVCMCVGGGRKPDNLQETHANAGRSNQTSALKLCVNTARDFLTSGKFRSTGQARRSAEMCSVCNCFCLIKHESLSDEPRQVNA